MSLDRKTKLRVINFTYFMYEAVPLGLDIRFTTKIQNAKLTVLYFLVYCLVIVCIMEILCQGVSIPPIGVLNSSDLTASHTAEHNVTATFPHMNGRYFEAPTRYTCSLMRYHFQLITSLLHMHLKFYCKI